MLHFPLSFFLNILNKIHLLSFISCLIYMSLLKISQVHPNGSSAPAPYHGQHSYKVLIISNSRGRWHQGFHSLHFTCSDFSLLFNHTLLPLPNHYSLAAHADTWILFWCGRIAPRDVQTSSACPHFLPPATVTWHFSPDGFQDVSLQSCTILDHLQMESVYLQLLFWTTNKYIKQYHTRGQFFQNSNYHGNTPIFI